MAAIKTVARRPPPRKRNIETTAESEPANNPPEPIRPRHGVVTLFGYGINVRVDRGHLILQDGIGPARRGARLPRVGHGLERLVVIGNDGFVSLAALRWLADQKASFVMLERDGSVLITTSPARSSEPKLRRAQARADESGLGLKIARALIHEKLARQEKLVRDKLNNSEAADQIARFRESLPGTEDISSVRLMEAQGASAYWYAFRNLQITFPKKDEPRVPDHWRTFASRTSPLTRSPRLAADPANAILNYLYAVLESEARLAAAAVGLDPALGFLHVDTPHRDSLASDLMEPVRPQVDDYVFDWITREPLSREWFFEQRDGNCRLMGPFAARLAETASTWRQIVAPYAEWVTHTLWSKASTTAHGEPLATPLTQRRKRLAKGAPPLPRTKRPPRVERLCRICGTTIPSDHTFCRPCAITFNTEQVVKASAAGRTASQRPIAQAQRSAAQRENAAAVKQWDPASQPDWLTAEAYAEKIQPLLAHVRPAAIAAAIGVTWQYASFIRRGLNRPHPRHWVKLAELVGLTGGGLSSS
jgi:CRISPR-associated endonuclease Cas1